MGIFKSIRAPILSVLNDLMNDTDLRVIVTYNLYKGREFDSTKGYNTDTYTTYAAVPAIELRHTKNSIVPIPASSKVEIGDIVYMFRFADLPSGLSLKDQMVTQHGNTVNLKSIDPIFGLAIAITIKG